MKGIKLKIMAAIMLCSIVTGVGVGLVSIYRSIDMLKDYSNRNMSLLAESKANELNVTINQIEASVNGLSVSILALLDDVKAFQRDPDYVKEYQERIRPIAKALAEDTNGAMAFYVRFNPTYTDPTSGVFHADTDGDGTIEQLVPTDFSQYEPSDLAHVGWYYIPIKAGKATWLDPYRNENIQTDMISYVVPLFKDGEPVGVVGMDVNYDRIKNLVQSIKPFENSYGALINGTGQFLIHPEYKQSDSLSELNPSLFKTIQEHDTGVTNTSFGGRDMLVSHKLLLNGQALLVVSPRSEIYADVNSLATDILWLVAGALILSVLIALLLSGRMTKPIHRLIADMKKVSDGDLTVQTSIESKDEFREIGDNFNKMVRDLSKLSKNIIGVSNQIREASGMLFSVSDSVKMSINEAATSVEEIVNGNNEQAMSIEDCANISTEMKDKYKQLQLATRHVLDTIDLIQKDNKEGMTTIEKLEYANRGNLSAAEEIESATTELQHKAMGINQILTTISAIAGQTNLLALNASIEASRAGDAGRGFAVVASEIRKLSEQSNTAADDILALVSELESDVRRSVDAMTAVKESTSEQAITVTRVSNAFQAISSSVDVMTGVMQDNGTHIASIGEHVYQVQEKLESMTSVSEESSALSEEVAMTMVDQQEQLRMVASAADELKGMVETLNGLVHRFKVEK